MISSSGVENFAGALRVAHLATVLENAITDSRRLLRFRIDVGNIGNVNRRFFLDDPAGLAGAWPRVALHHVDALHKNAVLRAQHAQNLAVLALIATGQNHDLVALFDLEAHGSEHLGRERDDLHEFPRAQFARHWTEDAGPDRLVLRRDEHRGVAVEADRRAVRTADRIGGAHDHSLVHIALFDAATRDRVLHRHDNDVADGRGTPLAAAQHLDALDAARTGIVGHIEIGLHLDHGGLLRLYGRLGRLGRACPARTLFGRRLIDLDRGHDLARRDRLAAGQHDPALGFRDRTALLDAHEIADLVRVGLVMRGIFFRAHDEFLIDGMHHATLDPDDHGLVRLVRDNHAGQNTLWHC